MARRDRRRDVAVAWRALAFAATLAPDGRPSGVGADPDQPASRSPSDRPQPGPADPAGQPPHRHPPPGRGDPLVGPARRRPGAQRAPPAGSPVRRPDPDHPARRVADREQRSAGDGDRAADRAVDPRRAPRRERLRPRLAGRRGVPGVHGPALSPAARDGSAPSGSWPSWCSPSRPISSSGALAPRPSRCSPRSSRTRTSVRFRPPPPQDRERLNVLLIGVDSAPGRTEALTDSLIVVSLDPVGRTVSMVSIPRDLASDPARQRQHLRPEDQLADELRRPPPEAVPGRRDPDAREGGRGAARDPDPLLREGRPGAGSSRWSTRSAGSTST